MAPRWAKICHPLTAFGVHESARLRLAEGGAGGSQLRLSGVSAGESPARPAGGPSFTIRHVKCSNLKSTKISPHGCLSMRGDWWKAPILRQCTKAEAGMGSRGVCVPPWGPRFHSSLMRPGAAAPCTTVMVISCKLCITHLKVPIKIVGTQQDTVMLVHVTP